MRAGCGSTAARSRIGNGRDPARFHPDPAGARPHPRRTRRARPSGSWWSPCRAWCVTRAIPNCWPPCASVDAELWVVGERLASRPRRGHGAVFRRLRPRAAAAPAWLPRGHARAARGRRHLRAAQPFRGAADVGDRGDADRAAGGRDRHQRPARAGGGGRDRIPGSAGARPGAGGGACAASPGMPRCARAWAPPAGRGRWSCTTRRKVVARTLDLLGL